jgi:transcriptional regulator with XRE-family HTH domain
MQKTANRLGGEKKSKALTGVKVEKPAERPMAFRDLLKADFLKRCRSNPSYSLRSYARQLGVDASLLSKILRGQRRPSEQFVQTIGALLGLRPSQLAALLDGTATVSYSKVNDDVFSVISDWYHFAILELMKTKGFVDDPAWIAQRLSIHKAEAEAALERLERLEFIEVDGERYVLTARNNTWANNEITTAARRNLQKQLTKKALEALDDVPFEMRESGSLTIACPRDLLPEVKKRIQVFRKSLDEFIESHGQADEVYQLLVAFYPLTNPNFEKE